MTTPDVCVSHNGREKPVIERLCWALLDTGLRPWFGKWDLSPVRVHEVELRAAEAPGSGLAG